MASTPRIEQTVQQAPFIFVATVVKLSASTVSSFAVQAGTVIVNITRTIRTPEVIGNLAGQQITVQLVPPLNVKVGDQAIFYTRGLVYAASIVVQEVAPRHPATGPAGTQHLALVSNVVGRLPDIQVKAHSAEADLVVVGKITSINLVTPVRPMPITHHLPLWQEAVLQVESVEVGSLDQKTVAFLFPASDDVKWHHTPKFKVGMEGVFLLHRRKIQELDQERLAVVDPMDYHPRERVDAIRKELQVVPPVPPVAPPAPPAKAPAGKRPKRGPKK